MRCFGTKKEESNKKCNGVATKDNQQLQRHNSEPQASTEDWVKKMNGIKKVSLLAFNDFWDWNFFYLFFFSILYFWIKKGKLICNMKMMAPVFPTLIQRTLASGQLIGFGWFPAPE
jgi:hypothetical protein